VSALRAFDVRVSAVRRLSPTYQRVTFAGPSLADFHDGGPLGSRDLRVKLMLPHVSGAELPDLSELTEGWYQRWLALPPEVRGSMRTYTVRRIRGTGAAREIDIDFVLHLDERGRGGPASAWAAGARVGDPLTILGPRATTEHYGGITWHPPSASRRHPVRVLLAGDETAVPAIGAVLATLGEDCYGHAVLEVPHPEDFQDLHTPADLEVVWLARGRQPHGDRLVPTVHALAQVPARPSEELGPEAEDEVLWDVPEPTAAAAPRFLAWTAGEAAMVRRLRAGLGQGGGLGRGQAAYMGYWRRGRAEAG
jgi:NADPH-dependent ferric siderophore reductase